MPPKKRHRRQDSSVVLTEPDTNRATGDPEVDEFNADEVKPMVVIRPGEYSTRRLMRLQWANARKSSETTEEQFPFLMLLPELRNMIYRYLVVSKAPGPIRLSNIHWFARGGIETAILAVNRQIHNEAAKILYHENECEAIISAFGRCPSGVAVRYDEEKTASATLRTLRTGLQIDMRKHHGLIYWENLQRLRRVEFGIHLFDRTMYWDKDCLELAKLFRTDVLSLSHVIADRWVNGRVADPSRDWVISIKCDGEIPLSLFEKVLEPLVSWIIVLELKDGHIRIELDGKLFPPGWKRVFSSMIHCEGFDATKVEEAKEAPRDIDPVLVAAHFGYP